MYISIKMKHLCIWIVFFCNILPITSAESPIIEGPTSYNFIVGNPPAEYVLFNDVTMTKSEAETLCRSQQQSSHLVSLNQLQEAKTVINGLLSLKRLHGFSGAIWIQGTAPPNKMGLLSYDDIIIDGHGNNCVVLTDWNSENKDNSFHSFRIYQRNCDRATKLVLCEVQPISYYKYLIAQGIGGCPAASSGSINGSIFMSASNCTSIGGSHDGLSSAHALTNCYLNWCAVHSSTGGWAFSRNGLCASKRYFKAGVRISAAPCIVARGIYEHRGMANQPTCWFQLCYLGETPPNRDTFALMGSLKCPIDRRNSMVSIYTRTDQCFRAGGEVFGRKMLPYVKDRWIQCLFKMCRLGTDCKTSEQGKEYRGSLDKTVSGRKCQYWGSQTPHRHRNTAALFPDSTLSEARNYCRNPGSWAEGPYCYTTDPQVRWEMCDLPFCKESGPDVTSFEIGETTYIYVPGLHNSPEKYCQRRFGAGLAYIQDKYELEKISENLMNLVNSERIRDIQFNEIWVEGKTRLHPNVLVEDFNEVVNEDWPENCLLLSRWNDTSKIYNSRHFAMYSSKCASFQMNFLCELVEVKIPSYQIYGGTLQKNISDEFACKVSCVLPCTGVNFDTIKKKCYFLLKETVCRPGRQNSQINTYRKKNCECNRYLVTGTDGIPDNKLTASSVYNGSAWSEIHTASRARLNSNEIITSEGTYANAWVASITDIETPWIQAEFPTTREVFGVLIAGRPSRTWVSRFSINFSEDCKTFTPLKAGGETVLFDGNLNSDDTVTITFPRFILARCVRIQPRVWQETLAMKFDLLGCVYSRSNVALNKPAQQSSTHGGYGLQQTADKAVDGFNQGNYKWGKCSHTRPREVDPWWMVHLEDTYRITEVLITNREDCCSNRLIGAQVYVTKTFARSFSKERIQSEPRCGTVHSVSIIWQEEISVICGEGLVGRNIVIIPHGGNILNICEVKVYGEKVETINYASKRTAYQSSTENILGAASHAVDGKHDTNYRNGFCSKTLSENKPWWGVDLGFEVKVESVLITNRGDCCGENLGHFTVLVGDTLQHDTHMHKCSYIEQSLENGETRHIICDKTVLGRVVKIQLDFAGPLALCEVEVYGERAEVLTFGGNARGVPCHFPFVDENGRSHDGCILGSRGHDWCGTSTNDTSEWGYCQDVRLIGGRYRGEGRVEVRRNVSWGGVCDDGWNDINSQVACQQLGYEAGRAIYPPFFSTGANDVFISEVLCRGNETGLVDCDYMDGTWHACSSHEDAGIQCYDSEDTTFYHGAPAIERQYTEEWWSGVILLPSSDVIPNHGRIVAWDVYAIAPVSPSDILTLQVWRYLGHDTFVLIGFNDINIPSKGSSHEEVLPENQISVMPGDVLGIKFLQNNPIPFDYSFSCVDDRVYYYQNISDLNPGDTVRFESKTTRNRCKLYSVSAKLEKDESNYLPDFEGGSSVYLILSEQHLPLVDAEVQCVLNLGINGTVLRISSAEEYHEVNQELLQRALFGEFWLENVRSDLINLTNADWLEWARCDPDPGKNCLVLSRESNLEHNFKWKSSRCDKGHLIICERNDGIEEYEQYDKIQDYFTYFENVTEASSYTEKQKMTSKKSVSAAIVLPIIFTILVVMVVLSVYFIKRWRSSHPIYSNLATPTYRSDDDAVDLGNSDNQFHNPMYEISLENNHKLEDNVSKKIDNEANTNAND